MMKDFKGTIICASKYFNTEEMRYIYHQGYHDFGENKVQNFLEKKEALNDLNISWHFIGHLQTNKVKKIINHIDYLHTLDSIHLANMIESHRLMPLPCFIQLNLTEEPQKSGIFEANLEHFMNEMKKYDKIKPVGFMTMGKVDDALETDKVFQKLSILAAKYQLPFKSMGMTDDYEIAMKHHATHLRIGRWFKTVLK